MALRIGFGVDFHQLAEGREFWLGGVRIPHDRGAVGHSDADVLIHAICDAMLGALNLGDIGMHFPDTDAAYKNIDSKILLQRTFGLIKAKGWRIVNIDSTVALEAPKIMKFAPVMRQTMAELLEMTAEEISIKATTTEEMGFVGRGEGLVAYATVLLGMSDSLSSMDTNSNVRVKIINQSPHPLPAYATEGSAGMDLRADLSAPVELKPLERQMIPTGIYIELPPGYEAQVRPRSGLAAKQGITCLNSPGTVDSDYRGELKVILINLSSESQLLHPGDRIAQLVVGPVVRVEWEEVGEIGVTARNAGGFGHTGKG